MNNKKAFIVILIAPFLFGFNWFGSKINQGNRLFKDGKKEEALKLYRDAQIDDPQNPVIFYNVGNALASLNKHPEAESEFLKAALTSDKQLEAKTYYNLGNNYYRQGKYDEAIKMYEKALDTNPNDEDAKYNIELVRKKIKEMMANQEKRQSEQQQSASDKKKEKDQNESTDKKDASKKDKEQKAAGQKEAEKEKKQGEKSSGQQDKEQAGAPEEKKEGVPKDKGEQMSKEDASRILNALIQEEKDLMRNSRQATGAEAAPEKDW